jgi:hypothetical protein
MDRKETAVFIDFTAHKFQNILLLKFGAQDLDGRFNFGTQGLVFFFRRKLKKGLQIFHFAPEIPPGLVAVFEGFELPHQLFGLAAVAPEIRLAGLCFQFGYALRKISVLKDASRYC